MLVSALRNAGADEDVMACIVARLVLLYSLGLSVTIWEKWRTEESADWRQPELHLSPPWSPMSANSTMPACGSTTDKLVAMHVTLTVRVTWWIWLWNELEEDVDTFSKDIESPNKTCQSTLTMTNFSEKESESEWNMFSLHMKIHATYCLRNECQQNKTQVKSCKKLKIYYSKRTKIKMKTLWR